MFDWLLNSSKADFDAGKLTFATSWSPWWLCALVIIAALLIGFSLWRKRQHLSGQKLTVLWFLQTAIAALLLVMIWQPALKVQAIAPGENSVVVLLDTSASMQVESDGANRYTTSRDTLTNDLIPDLKKYFNISTATFDNELEWQELPESPDVFGQRSNISKALLDVLDQARANPLTAVVIATDGSDNSNALQAEFWDKLSNYNVPVHTVGVGEINLANDTEVVAVDLASATMPGSVESARVTVQHGTQETLRVKVYSGEDIIAIEEQPLPQQAGQATVDIDINADTSGIQELRFEAESTASDIAPDNNSRKRLLQVRDNKRKILYFEGEPRWEYKFIRRAITRTPGISLATILRTTPNKFYRQGIDSPDQHADGFPKSKEELYSYDAVIIGNVESISLNGTQQKLLHDYVSERGGTLMMMAGDKALADGGWHSSPLANTLPVTLEASNRATYNRIRARAELTTAGNHSPITRFDSDPQQNITAWSSLPELADFQYTGDVKPGANVLLSVAMDNQNYPLLTHQRYGAGNTYLLATSGTWRWQMQLPHEDQHHEIFWRQLLQSIAAGAPQQMQVSTDRQIYLDETQIKITAKLFDEEFNPLVNGEVVATLTAPDGSKVSAQLNASADEAGIYNATVEAPQTGSWQIDITTDSPDTSPGTSNDTVQDTTATTNATTTNGESANISPPNKLTPNTLTHWVFREDGTAEQYGLAQNETFLKRVADTTRGGYHTLEQAASIADTLRSGSSGIVREQSRPLWSAPLFFLLLIGLKLFEWFLRLFWGRL